MGFEEIYDKMNEEAAKPNTPAKEPIVNPLIEVLAKLEHEQWVEWAKSILESETISKERADRWKKYFVSYEQLPEDTKNLDRVWAEKVLEAIEEYKANDNKEQ